MDIAKGFAPEYDIDAIYKDKAERTYYTIIELLAFTGVSSSVNYPPLQISSELSGGNSLAESRFS